MKRDEYIRPQLDIVPYREALMVIAPSAETGIDEGGLFSKEFDDFEEDNSLEDDLWKDEREGFGLQDWDVNMEE